MKSNSSPDSQSSTPVSQEQEQVLKEALQRGYTGLDRIVRPRMYLVRMLTRIEKTSVEIDEAFAWAPLSPNVAPDDPANVRRCTTYIRLHRENTELFCRVLDLWMLSFGYLTESGRRKVPVARSVGPGDSHLSSRREPVAFESKRGIGKHGPELQDK